MFSKEYLFALFVISNNILAHGLEFRSIFSGGVVGHSNETGHGVEILLSISDFMEGGAGIQKCDDKKREGAGGGVENLLSRKVLS